MLPSTRIRTVAIPSFPITRKSLHLSYIVTISFCNPHDVLPFLLPSIIVSFTSCGILGTTQGACAEGMCGSPSRGPGHLGRERGAQRASLDSQYTSLLHFSHASCSTDLQGRTARRCGWCCESSVPWRALFLAQDSGSGVDLPSCRWMS